MTHRRQQTDRDPDPQLTGALSEAIPLIGWVEDDQGSVIHVNQRWCDYTGWTADESLGQAAWRVFAPEDRTGVPLVWRSPTADAATGIEVRLRRADGLYRWHLCRTLPVTAPDGTRLGWLGTAVDIHMTKQAEVNRNFLEDLSYRVAQVRDPGERAWTLVQALCRHLDADRSTLSDVALNDRLLVTEFDVWRGERRVFTKPKVRGYSDLAYHDRYAAGRTVVVEDTMTDPATRRLQEDIGQDRLRSFIGVPCMREGQWSALLGVASTSPRIWTGDEIRLVETVAERFWPLIEQSRAESAMRDSEARFRAIFEQAAIGVAQVRLDGIIIAANPSLCAWLGYDEPELYHRPLADITLAEDFEMQRRQMDQLVAGEKAYFAQEKRYIHRNGEIVWGMLSMSLVRDQTGNPRYFISATSPIGARKQAEQRLTFLADASKELAAELDYRTTLQRVADTMVPHMADWCAVTTLEAGNVLEQVAVAHVDPAKVDWVLRLDRRHPTDLETGVGAARVIRTGEAAFYPDIPDELLEEAISSAEQRQVAQQLGLKSIMIVPMQARDHVVGALTFAWADSDRRYTEADLVFAEELGHRAAVAIDNARLYESVRRAEHQQAELLAELESLFANAPIGIAFVDPQFRFVRANESMAHLGGVSVDALLGRSVGETLTDLAPLFEPPIRQVFDTDQGLFGIELNGHVAGDPHRLHYWDTSWYPIISEGGRVRHVGLMLVDITDRKESELALRQSEERFRATFDQAAVGVAHTHTRRTLAASQRPALRDTWAIVVTNCCKCRSKM